MTRFEHNGAIIELYGSIKELPIARKKLFQLLILQDSGIGSDMAAIDQRLEKVLMFAGTGKTEEMREEVTNLRFTFHSMIKGIDYKTRSFATLICKINGVEQSDMSDEGLKNAVKVLEDLQIPAGQIEDWWDGVKKNLISN